jgi:ABC-type dipeptide/oligopeptide/nickel transport system permease component
MGIPSTLISGSIAYLVLGAVAIGGIFSMRSMGKLSKDDAA